MAQTYFPFDSGQGANVTETMWGQMAQLWLKTGVISGQLSQLNTYADSTGMQVKVDTGIAWIQGYYFKNDSVVTLPIAAADPSNPRIDRVIIRVDWAANTIQLAILQGPPLASPLAPSISQNTSRWEIPLAQIAVGAGVTTIAAGNVTDERTFTQNANAIQSNFTSVVGQNGWAWPSSGYEQPQYMKDEMGFVHFKGVLAGGTTTQGTVIFTLPPGYRPSSIKFVSLITWYVNGPEQSVIYINPDGTVTCYATVGNTILPLNMIPAFKAFN